MKKIKEAVINADPCMKGLIVVMIDVLVGRVYDL